MFPLEPSEDIIKQTMLLQIQQMKLKINLKKLYKNLKMKSIPARKGTSMR